MVGMEERGIVSDDIMEYLRLDAGWWVRGGS